MKRIHHIFVPEWVPLENKGEEAIIRGMGDVLFPEGNVEFHILDMLAKEYRFVEGLHVYPANWFYSRWRSLEFNPGPRFDQIVASLCSVLRNGFDRFLPWWVMIPQRPVRKTARQLRHLRHSSSEPSSARMRALKRILDCDFLLAGHDGALNEYDCHVINMMRGFGMRFGVFGSSMKPNTSNPYVVRVFAAALQHAEFVFCRHDIATNWAKLNFPSLDVKTAPDPAFGMRPGSQDKIRSIIEREGLAEFFSQPVVMFTACEPASIARRCFRDLSSRSEKVQAHRAMLAHLAQHVVKNYPVNLLFLPHAIGPTRELDDRLVGLDILGRIDVPKGRARVLEAELSPRELKGLIREAEVLVAERAHSAIAAVGMEVPFMLMGPSHNDYRLSGIFREMLGLEDQICYLDQPSVESMAAFFDDIWERREAIRCRLREKSIEIATKLSNARSTMVKAMQPRNDTPQTGAGE